MQEQHENHGINNEKNCNGNPNNMDEEQLLDDQNGDNLNHCHSNQEIYDFQNAQLLQRQLKQLKQPKQPTNKGLTQLIQSEQTQKAHQVPYMQQQANNQNQDEQNNEDQIYEDQTMQPEMQQEQYQPLEGYIICKTLGKGNFGKVKLAVHKLTQQFVAVKILEKDLIFEHTDIVRISRQLKIMKKLRHPFVVQLYQIIQTQKQLYLIMEYAEGGDLFDKIVKQQRIKQKQAARIFSQIALGIQYIHKKGVTHRDLKPQNILMSKDGTIKIADFGLGNMFKPDQKLKTACGSPCYASPQMLNKQQYDPKKIDIWSSGIIMYAMVCGYLPFQDQVTSKLYEKIKNTNVKLPSWVTSPCRNLIRGLLTKDPKLRFDIDSILNHEMLHQDILDLKQLVEQKLSIQNKIDEICQKYQIEQKEKLSSDLNKNRHNNLTTLYFLGIKRMEKQCDEDQDQQQFMRKENQKVKLQNNNKKQIPQFMQTKGESQSKNKITNQAKDKKQTKKIQVQVQQRQQIEEEKQSEHKKQIDLNQSKHSNKAIDQSYQFVPQDLVDPIEGQNIEVQKINFKRQSKVNDQRQSVKSQEKYQQMANLKQQSEEVNKQNQNLQKQDDRQNQIFQIIQEEPYFHHQKQSNKPTMRKMSSQKQMGMEIQELSQQQHMSRSYSETKKLQIPQQKCQEPKISNNSSLEIHKFLEQQENLPQYQQKVEKAQIQSNQFQNNQQIETFDQNKLRNLEQISKTQDKHLSHDLQQISQKESQKISKKKQDGNDLISQSYQLSLQIQEQLMQLSRLNQHKCQNAQNEQKKVNQEPNLQDQFVKVSNQKQQMNQKQKQQDLKIQIQQIEQEKQDFNKLKQENIGVEIIEQQAKKFIEEQEFVPKGQNSQQYDLKNIQELKHNKKQEDQLKQTTSYPLQKGNQGQRINQQQIIDNTLLQSETKHSDANKHQQAKQQQYMKQQEQQKLKQSSRYREKEIEKEQWQQLKEQMEQQKQEKKQTQTQILRSIQKQKQKIIEEPLQRQQQKQDNIQKIQIQLQQTNTNINTQISSINQANMLKTQINQTLNDIKDKLNEKQQLVLKQIQFQPTQIQCQPTQKQENKIEINKFQKGKVNQLNQNVAKNQQQINQQFIKNLQQIQQKTQLSNQQKKNQLQKQQLNQSQNQKKIQIKTINEDAVDQTLINNSKRLVFENQQQIEEKNKNIMKDQINIQSQQIDKQLLYLPLNKNQINQFNSPLLSNPLHPNKLLRQPHNNYLFNQSDSIKQSNLNLKQNSPKLNHNKNIKLNERSHSKDTPIIFKSNRPPQIKNHQKVNIAKNKQLQSSTNIKTTALHSSKKSVSYTDKLKKDIKANNQLNENQKIQSNTNDTKYTKKKVQSVKEINKIKPTKIEVIQEKNAFKNSKLVSNKYNGSKIKQQQKNRVKQPIKIIKDIINPISPVSVNKGKHTEQLNQSSEFIEKFMTINQKVQEKQNKNNSYKGYNTVRNKMKSFTSTSQSFIKKDNFANSPNKNHDQKMQKQLKQLEEFKNSKNIKKKNYATGLNYMANFNNKVTNFNKTISSFNYHKNKQSFSDVSALSNYKFQPKKSVSKASNQNLPDLQIIQCGNLRIEKSSLQPSLINPKQIIFSTLEQLKNLIISEPHEQLQQSRSSINSKVVNTSLSSVSGNLTLYSYQQLGYVYVIKSNLLNSQKKLNFPHFNDSQNQNNHQKQKNYNQKNSTNYHQRARAVSQTIKAAQVNKNLSKKSKINSTQFAKMINTLALNE